VRILEGPDAGKEGWVSNSWIERWFRPFNQE
jgi:hypothetical protein